MVPVQRADGLPLLMALEHGRAGPLWQGGLLRLRWLAAAAVSGSGCGRGSSCRARQQAPHLNLAAAASDESELQPVPPPRRALDGAQELRCDLRDRGGGVRRGSRRRHSRNAEVVARAVGISSTRTPCGEGRAQVRILARAMLQRCLQRFCKTTARAPRRGGVHRGGIHMAAAAAPEDAGTTPFPERGVLRHPDGQAVVYERLPPSSAAGRAGDRRLALILCNGLLSDRTGCACCHLVQCSEHLRPSSCRPSAVHDVRRVQAQGVRDPLAGPGERRGGGAL